MPRVETVLPEPAIISLDVCEELNNGGAFMIQRRGASPWANRLQLLDTVVAAPIVVRPGGDGLFWRQATSAVATVTGTGMSVPGWPCGNDYTGDPVSTLWPMSWRFQCLVKRTTPLTANAPFFFGVVGNTLTNPFSTAFPVWGLHSASTENGGRWTAYMRPRKGAAIIAVDTGVDPAAGPALLEIFYRDTTNPQCVTSINGVVVDTKTGIANVPQQGAADNDWLVGCTNGYAVGGAAGQVDRWRHARLTVTELSGFPS